MIDNIFYASCKMFCVCMCSDPFAEGLRFKTNSTLPRIIKLRQTSKAIDVKMSSGEVCIEQVRLSHSVKGNNEENRSMSSRCHYVEIGLLAKIFTHQ